MSDDKPKTVKKGIEDPSSEGQEEYTRGGQELPSRELTSAIPNGVLKTGKPRPPSD